MKPKNYKSTRNILEEPESPGTRLKNLETELHKILEEERIQG